MGVRGCEGGGRQPLRHGCAVPPQPRSQSQIAPRFGYKQSTGLFASRVAPVRGRLMGWCRLQCLPLRREVPRRGGGRDNEDQRYDNPSEPPTAAHLPWSITEGKRPIHEGRLDRSLRDRSQRAACSGPTGPNISPERNRALLHRNCAAEGACV